MSFCRQKKEELAQKVAEERARREEEARRLEAEQARQREEQLRRQAEEERERREREGEERAQKQVGVRPAGPWGGGRVSRVGVQVLPPRLVHALASCTSPRALAPPPPGAPSSPPHPHPHPRDGGSEQPCWPEAQAAFLFPEGRRSSRSGGSREGPAGAGEALPERRAGAPGKKEGDCI